MISNELKGLLGRLNLLNTNTVYFFEQKSKWEKVISPETAKKIEKIKPRAFYVFNGRPYILFFEIPSLFQDDTKEKEIHKQVWSFDQSPLIFILKQSEIEIFNAFSYDKKKSRLEQVRLKEDESVDDLFSFWKLQSGSTWKWLQENHYKKNILDKRVNQKLFENIRIVRETLTDTADENSFTEDEANILILRLIFIRYLIDRGVKLDATYISGNSLHERRKSLVDLIGKPRKLNAFFQWLNNKFNGVLFKDVQVSLSKEKAAQLALVFKGETPEGIFEGGDFYFDVFDFSIIPVELISGIYESLIDENTRKSHSAVYTPPFLVEYILSNTVDIFFNKKENKYEAECKIFDPSVGSGIFLVQAFRRMVDREIQLTGSKKIKRARLKEIVYNNLFGIDVNEQALKVTCFSIYIAMLDYFDPNSILPNFEFPDLIGSNLFLANFFDEKHNYNAVISEKNIDFILGNPPWKSDKDEVHIRWLKENNKTVGRFEIAQSFLLRSKDFMSPETTSALIVTSTIFYNISATTKKFKQEFLTQFCINQFFDLSAVRRLVFEEKNSPCSIVFYRLADGDSVMDNVVNHLSIKSNMFLKFYRALVIEKFDKKQIQQKHFIENDWMFKVALYGNTLDFALIKRLSESDSISKYWNKKIRTRDGLKRDVISKFNFPDVDKYIIEKENIHPYYTPILKESVPENVSKLFGFYKILIKGQTKNESDIVVSYNKGNAIYRNDTFIIFSDEEIVKILYSYFISNLYTHFIFLTSSTWGIATRPAIRLEEVVSFPFKKPTKGEEETLVNLINTFLKNYVDFYEQFSLGQPNKNQNVLKRINHVVESLYKIKGYEKDTIDYVLEISRYQFQESKQQRIIRPVHNDCNALENYAEIFINEFKDIYEGEHLQVHVYALNHFIAMNFVFSTQRQEKKVVIKYDIQERDLFNIIAEKASISEISKELFVQKDIKGFEENSFYIIKPNEYKCWHRAIAWYDVAEIKQKIEEAEISHLNKNIDE